jgi:hypothetical protein
VKKSIKIILLVVLLVFLVLAWAPWMNNKKIYDQVLKEKGKIDGTIDKETGDMICDYEVQWIPFGRYVASCEGSYEVMFYDNLS